MLHRTPPLLRLALLAACAGLALRAQAPLPIDLDRPPFRFLRNEEDWSGFEPRAGDYLSRLKWLQVDDTWDVHLSVGGSQRVLWDRRHSLGFGPADDGRLLWRSLLHGDLHFGTHARAFVELMHANTTPGDLPGGRRPQDVQPVEFQQAFAELRLDGTASGSQVRIGRQALLRGAERLVSPAPWTNTLRRWDGVSLRLAADEVAATGFWTQFVPGDPRDLDRADRDEQFFGVAFEALAEADAPERLEAYYLARLRTRRVLGVGATSGGEERHTLGVRVARIPDRGFAFDVEAAWQFGRLGQESIGAWFAAAELGHRGDGRDLWSRVYGGVELASGGDALGGGTFDPLYPDGHRHLGVTDEVGQRNIASVWLGHSMEPLDAWEFDGQVISHWRLDDRDGLYDADSVQTQAAVPGAGRHVGVELALTARYAFDRHAALTLGWARLWRGEFLDDAGLRNDPQRWFAEFLLMF